MDSEAASTTASRVIAKVVALTLLIAAPATVMGAVRDGRAHAIAIGTTGGRIPSLPNVATAKEQGFDFTYSFWYGMLGPRGMDQGLVAAIKAECDKVLANPGPVVSTILTVWYKSHLAEGGDPDPLMEALKQGN